MNTPSRDEDAKNFNFIATYILRNLPHKLKNIAAWLNSYLSIPTDEEIEEKAHNNYTYGYLMPIGSHDRSRYEEKKESYTSGYKQALIDIQNQTK
jgi:hypothetical protein